LPTTNLEVVIFPKRLSLIPQILELYRKLILEAIQFSKTIYTLVLVAAGLAAGFLSPSAFVSAFFGLPRPLAAAGALSAAGASSASPPPF